MLVFRNIRQTTKYKAFMRVSCYSSKRESVDLVYNTYENVETANNLPPLIVMHGLFGSKQNWRGLCKQLLKKLKNRKVILVDARNHGESPHTPKHRYEDMAEDIVQLMKKEKLQLACLMGHSMGGKCMMYTSLKYPHLIEKIIVLDISPLSASASVKNMSVIFDALKHVHVPQKLEMSDARKEADRQLQKQKIENPYVRTFLLSNFIKDSSGEFRWRFNVEALSNSFASDILYFPKDAVKLKYFGPVLFIGGADSDLISTHHLAKIQKLYFPSAQLIMLKNAGHLIHIDQPALLIDLVVKFLSNEKLFK